MTHPLFRKDIFVETAFEKRFQQMLHSAWDNRSWHVIAAGRAQLFSNRQPSWYYPRSGVSAAPGGLPGHRKQSLGPQLLGWHACTSSGTRKLAHRVSAAATLLALHERLQPGRA